MTIAHNPPQYSNQPVILVHFTVTSMTPPIETMYWCAPYPFVEPSENAYPEIPRVPCPACHKAVTLAH
jgi:hypothetical protein